MANPDLKQLERIIDAVDQPVVIVVATSPGETVQTISKGVESDEQWFWIFWQLATQAAEHVYDKFTPEQKAAMKIILPSAEDAKRLGIYRNGHGS